MQAWLKQFSAKESSYEASPASPTTVGKLSWAHVFTWAKPLLTMESKGDQTVPGAQANKPPVKGDPSSSKDITQEMNQVLIQNPEMSASTLINLLKSKGYEIVDKKSAVRDQMSKQDQLPKVPKTEADTAGANAAALRAGPIKKKSEARDFNLRGHIRFLESAASDNGIGPTVFKAILIQEGLGNLKDCFYYTKECLQNAAAVFEGKKIYADHPTSIEEQTRPERSVRDVLGHFESVKYVEDEEGRGMLEGDVNVLPGKSYDWARELMQNAVSYSQKYPDKDLIGLSINASGDSEEMPLEEFIKSDTIPGTAILKLQKAQEAGADTIRLVKNITDAVSCDMVSEAGAGGKVLNILEGEKMGKKEAKHAEEEAKKHEADPAHAADQDGGHDDEDQDMALIKKMLKKSALKDPEGDGEEHEDDEAPAKAKKPAPKHDADADGDEDDKHAESEGEEAGMKQAHEAHEAALKCGYEGEEAMKMAAGFMKMAKHMAAKHEAQEHEKKENGIHVADGGVKVESNKVIRLAAEVAALKEQAAKRDLKDHMEDVLSKSKLSREYTKLFKEAAGEIRSRKEFDSKFKLFVEGAKARGSETLDLSEAMVVSVEKQGEAGEGSLDFSNFLA